LIDASKGFVKDGNKNRLREQDIRKIIDVWNKQDELPKFSHFATNEEIEKNEYNLNLPRYVDTSDVEDIQDIEAHLKGGIPEYDIDLLDNYWTICPTLKAAMFKNARSGYFDVAIPVEEIRPVILENKEFLEFRKNFQKIFDNWQHAQIPFLKSLSQNNNPKLIILKLSDSLNHAR